MRCLDTIARYLFYTFVIDFSLEMLDLIHRIYEADESFQSLDFMVHTRLYTRRSLCRSCWGRSSRCRAGRSRRWSTDGATAGRGIYVLPASLILVGIFAMRWNVVIGGQLFSKSFLGYTTYKMDFATREGLLPAALLMLLPFGILWVLVKVLPPWPESERPAAAEGRAG